MRANWIVSISLLALAALSTWASLSLFRPLPSEAKRQSGADHAFIQPRAQIYNIQGQLAYRLEGERLQHRAESGDYLLSSAKLVAYSKQRPPEQPAEQAERWQMNAPSARLSHDGEQLDLQGQVTASRLGVSEDKRIQLFAQDVTLHKQAQTAQSTQPLLAQGQQWQSRSSAFQADLAHEQLEQTGRVYDHYQPQP